IMLPRNPMARTIPVGEGPMALAQIIHGTGDELIAYLQNRRDQKNLTLIVPEQEVAADALHQQPYPEGATVRNGVPLIPTEGRTEVVTPEHIRQLLDAEWSSEGSLHSRAEQGGENR